MCTLDVCESLETLALTKDGSQKKVKGTGNGKNGISQEWPDTESHRKLWAEHLHEGGQAMREVWCVRGEAMRTGVREEKPHGLEREEV